MMKDSTPDYKEFKKRVLLAIAGKPGTLYPLTAGIMTLSGTWALEISAGIPVFAGIALILLGAGSFLTSLLGQPGELEEKIVRTMNEEAARSREARLDDLGQRLVMDGDPRTEKSLSDLRALFSALEGHLEAGATGNDSGGGDPTTFLGILETAGEIFGTSVGALEKSLELWGKASALATAEARRPFLELREKLIINVEAGVSRLGQALANIEASGVENSAGRLEGLGRELDETLEVAKRVEERMKDITGSGSGSFETPGGV